jgi:riboflavin biosynthesis pyrimidine reductase
MMSTVDGRIITANWGSSTRNFTPLYEQCHNSFNSEAWMCGRVTMEKDFSKGEKPVLTKPANPIAREAFIGDKSAESFAIAVDAHGKLGWKDNEISGDHIIVVLTEQVGDEYLNYLQQKNISYIFAGKTEVDFKKALLQLETLFPINTIMLEGGGHLNGSMLKQGLINELSLLILPLADGTLKTPTTFEVGEAVGDYTATPLKLINIEKLEHDVIWLRYKY